MNLDKTVFASDAPVPKVDGFTGTMIGALVDKMEVAVVLGMGLGCTMVLSAFIRSAAYSAELVVVG